MIFIAIALGVFLLDYNIKVYTDRNRIQGTEESYLGGKLILRNCHNKDGGFGIFKNREKLGTELSMVVLICTLWEFGKALFMGTNRLVKLGLSLIAGGGLSNYYDRRTKGYVTDYVSFGVKNKKLRDMVFNLSDFFIFGGAAIFLAGQLLKCGKAPAEALSPKGIKAGKQNK